MKTNKWYIVLLLYIGLFYAFVSQIAYAQATIDWQRSIGGLNNEYFAESTININNHLYQTISVSWRFELDSAYFGYPIPPYINLLYYDTHLLSLRKSDMQGNTIWWKPITLSLPSPNDSAFISPRPLYASCKYINNTPYIYVYTSTPIPEDWTKNPLTERIKERVEVIKMDTMGNLIWHKQYGGGSYKGFYPYRGGRSLVVTEDGGAILTSSMYIKEYEVSQLFPPYYNAWIYRIDADGNLLWDASIGDYYAKVYPTNIALLPNQKVLVCGYYAAITDNGGNLHCFSENGKYDGFTAILDSETGELLDTRCYGGSGDDMLLHIIPLENNRGYMLCGESSSNDGDLSERPGSLGESLDGWLVYLDANLDMVWSHAFGSGRMDGFRTAFSTADNGFLCFGYVSDNDVDCQGNPPIHYQWDRDLWVVRLDSVGHLVSQRSLTGTYEGTEGTRNTSVIRLDQHKFLIHDIMETQGSPEPPGYLYCPEWTPVHPDPDDDSTESDHYNIWVAQVTDTCTYEAVADYETAKNIKVYPNPASDILTIDIPLSQSHRHNTIRIINMQGKTLWQQESDNQHHTIDISALPMGVYMVEVKNKIWTKYSKVVVVPQANIK